MHMVIYWYSYYLVTAFVLDSTHWYGICFSLDYVLASERKEYTICLKSI